MFVPKVHAEDAGDSYIVESGGKLELKTGATLVDTNGVDQAGALATLVAAVAAGDKVARGTVTPVSAAETVVTGLATVVAAVAQRNQAPTLTHMFTQADIGDHAGAPAAGSIIVRSQKPTASGAVTPIAATTPWGEVDWIAIGT